jgi:hypothetical protein
MEHILPLMAALEIHKGHYRSYGDYSATSLIDSPRIVQLKKRYGHLVEVDPERQMASFIGTGVHNYFEDTLRQYAALNKEYELERSVFDKIDDRLVTGRFDILYDHKHIYDIKTAKVWKKIFDPDMVDWHAQQNIYAWLLRRRGLSIESINIVAVYLDWQKNNALRDSNYPQQRVVQYGLTLWSPERQEEFVRERLSMHKNAEELSDEDLPACSPEERWERFPSGLPTQYALLKDSQAKRATRVFDTLNELRQFVNDPDPSKKSFAVTDSAIVEIRHAKRTRCLDWCDGAPFCNHYQQYMRDSETGNLNDYVSLREVL